MSKIDIEYYELVAVTQHNPEILKSELKDFICEVKNYLVVETNKCHCATGKSPTQIKSGLHCPLLKDGRCKGII